eukprot:31386-Pelagococcus_subviridis.AAC.6
MNDTRRTHARFLDNRLLQYGKLCTPRPSPPAALKVQRRRRLHVRRSERPRPLQRVQVLLYRVPRRELHLPPRQQIARDLLVLLPRRRLLRGDGRLRVRDERVGERLRRRLLRPLRRRLLVHLRLQKRPERVHRALGFERQLHRAVVRHLRRDLPGAAASERAERWAVLAVEFRNLDAVQPSRVHAHRAHQVRDALRALGDAARHRRRARGLRPRREVRELHRVYRVLDLRVDLRVGGERGGFRFFLLDRRHLLFVPRRLRQRRPQRARGLPRRL